MSNDVHTRHAPRRTALRPVLISAVIAAVVIAAGVTVVSVRSQCGFGSSDPTKAASEYIGAVERSTTSREVCVLTVDTAEPSLAGQAEASWKGVDLGTLQWRNYPELSVESDIQPVVGYDSHGHEVGTVMVTHGGYEHRPPFSGWAVYGTTRDAYPGAPTELSSGGN